jgi:hypothetical protein
MLLGSSFLGTVAHRIDRVRFVLLPFLALVSLPAESHIVCLDKKSHDISTAIFDQNKKN